MLTQDTHLLREVAQVVEILSCSLSVPPPPHFQRLVPQSLIQLASFKALVSLDAGARQHLECGTFNLINWNRRSVLPMMPQVIVELDTSKVGWGATYKVARTGGYWSPP